MSTLIRAALAASLVVGGLGACSPSEPVMAAPAPALAKPPIVPFPGARSALSKTKLHVSAQAPRLDVKSDTAWPAQGVWTWNMLVKRLGSLGLAWFDGDAARQRILTEEFPAVRDRLGMIAMERISLVPEIEHKPGSVVLTFDLAETGFSFPLETEEFVHVTLAFDQPAWRVEIEVPDEERGSVIEGGVLDGIFDLGEMTERDGQPRITAHLHAIRLRSSVRNEVLYDSLAEHRP